MINNDKISNTQLWMFIVLTTIGVGVFSLPRVAAEAADQDGWIVVVLGGVITLVDFYIISRLAKKFPGDTLVEMANKVLGKYLAVPVLIVFWLYMLSISAMTLRIFGEVVKMSILIRTPVEVILISILLLVLWLTRGGVEPISRFNEIIFPILIIVLVFAGLLTLPKSDFSNILPIFTIGAQDILKGAYQSAYSYAGFEFVFFIIPFIKKPERIFRPGAFAIAITSLVYVAAVILSLAKFGALQTKELIWPTLSLIRSVEVPGSFIERLEGIVMSQWVLLAFTTIVPVTFGVASLPSRMLKHREFKHFCTIAVPIVYLIAMVPDNIVETYEYLDFIAAYLQAPSIFIIPVLLLISSSIRKVGRKANG